MSIVVCIEVVIEIPVDRILRRTPNQNKRETGINYYGTQFGTKITQSEEKNTKNTDDVLL